MSIQNPETLLYNQYDWNGHWYKVFYNDTTGLYRQELIPKTGYLAAGITETSVRAFLSSYNLTAAEIQYHIDLIFGANTPPPPPVPPPPPGTGTDQGSTVWRWIQDNPIVSGLAFLGVAMVLFRKPAPFWAQKR